MSQEFYFTFALYLLIAQIFGRQDLEVVRRQLLRATSYQSFQSLKPLTRRPHVGGGADFWVDTRIVFVFLPAGEREHLGQQLCARVRGRILKGRSQSARFSSDDDCARP